MKKLFTSALATSVATVALATMLATSVASSAPLTFQSLSLLNGWTVYSAQFRAAKVAIDQDGVVHLMGGIKQTSGSSSHAFTLPAAFRPAKVTYVATTQSSSRPGRLEIDPDGQVFVDADENFGFAQIFTSLEGMTFAK